MKNIKEIKKIFKNFIKKQSPIRLGFLLVIFLVLLGIAGSFIYQQKDQKSNFSPQLFFSKSNSSLEAEAGGDIAYVSEQNVEKPRLYIRGNEEQNSFAAGVISLTSSEEPRVEIEAQNVSGIVQINVHKASIETLQTYLIHDDDNNQIYNSIDTSSLELVATLDHDLQSEDNFVILPVEESGIYYLEIKADNVEMGSFVLRSNVGVLAKEGDDQFIFWGQRFSDKKNIQGGNLEILNLKDSVKTLTQTTLDAEGIATSPISSEADVAIYNIDNEFSLVPLNLQRLNIEDNYKEFQEKQIFSKFFIFTDRPLYQSGDKINFKAVIRSDDDASYAIPSGAVDVRIRSYQWPSQVGMCEKAYTIDSFGSIQGECILPEDMSAGSYYIEVSLKDHPEEQRWFSSYSGRAYFKVEHFRKPEYSLDIETDRDEYVAGEEGTFFVSGTYFFGAPLTEGKVKYRVYSSSYNNFKELTEQTSLMDDRRYSYYGGNTVVEGEVELNDKGKAEVQFEAIIPEDSGQNQIYALEVEYNDGSGNSSFDRKNVLVNAAEFDIFRSERITPSITGESFNLPILLKGKENSTVSGRKIVANIEKVNWIKVEDPNKKYPAYKREDVSVETIKATSDDEGKATLTFIPKEQGSYIFYLEARDEEGNSVKKQSYVYIQSPGLASYSSHENEPKNLTILAEKDELEVSESAKLTISSSIPDRDVFFSMERGRVREYQIVHIEGNTAEIEVPINEDDMPNIFPTVSSFSNNALDIDSKNIIVSTAAKELEVSISSDYLEYGPGDTVQLAVETKDSEGRPVSADVAVWAVDKALFELTKNNLGDIMERFWGKRPNWTNVAHSLEGIIVYDRGGGGCFTAGTKILMADGSLKAIENIQVGETIMTRKSEINADLIETTVKDTHVAETDGYLIINKQLRITPNHILFVNGAWEPAGDIQIGDHLYDIQDKEIEVNSIEWQAGKETVYNLYINDNHTFFANGIWVHNDKGESGRTVFEDTAYWNPSVRTDNDGQAEIRFNLPDNLTTWIISGVGATADTMVGQTQEEILVNKDIIIRPILPNIVRQGDEIFLSALVHNNSDDDYNFDVSLEMQGVEMQSADHQEIFIASGKMKEVDWSLIPQTATAEAKVIFKAQAQENKKATDIVTTSLPIRQFGYLINSSQTGIDDAQFNLSLRQGTDSAQSDIKLALSTSILDTIPSSIEYLFRYPYGCVEQTTSRFAPAILAKKYPAIISGNTIEELDLEEKIQDGLNLLSELQFANGGWSWWGGNDADVFVSAYVLEYLLLAEEVKVDVADSMIEKARGYFEEKLSQENSHEDTIPLNYALTLLGSDKRARHLDNLENLDPDLLALAVMNNALNGDYNSQTNGLDILISKAKTEGETVYWKKSSSRHYGSIDASTGLAIQAIIIARGDQELTLKGVQYLINHRSHDYWSNTFGTVQVLRALAKLSDTLDEQDPDFTYSVFLDDEKIASGKTKQGQKIPEVTISAQSIQNNEEGSKISIQKKGKGKLYSTLILNEFVTDESSSAEEQGLNITRTYKGSNGKKDDFKVGDVVEVKLNVSGLPEGEQYAIIHDVLPSGLVPVNEHLTNEQINQESSSEAWDREYTENGVDISIRNWNNQANKTYTYHARVITAGTFLVPPAFVELMYAPEIYGHTETVVVKTHK
ncbi:MAG: alpha-2-macroglobulin family protein [Candidatus Portnoybacteria bacterium]